MHRHSWKPTRIRKWQDFMETGFQEFYIELGDRPKDNSHLFSSVLLIACFAVICVTVVLV